MLSRRPSTGGRAAGTARPPIAGRRRGRRPAEALVPLFTRVGRDGRLNSLSARSGIRVSIRGFRERPDCTALHCIRVLSPVPFFKIPTRNRRMSSVRLRD